MEWQGQYEEYQKSGQMVQNLNVFGYLSHLLTELPKLGESPSDNDLDELLPWSDKLPDYCR